MTRNQLIDRFAYLVPLTRQRCYPVPPARIAAEDLEGEGYLGLCRAAERYDPARGVAFRSYAITWIRWAMMEYLRQEDWFSRWQREQFRETGEEPPELVSLDEVMTGGRWEDDKRWVERLPDPGEGPEEEVCERWEASLIRGMVQWLPKRERKIVWLTEVEGLSARQVGEMLSLSESRVWQIRDLGKKRLRRFLAIAGVAG